MSDAPTHPPVSESDREVLAFLAAHGLVLESHVQTLLEVNDQVVRERLDALEAAGLARRGRVLLGGPGCYQITNPGLAVIGSDLPPPRLHPDGWRHDLWAAWVWLAGARGTFGPVDRVLSQREMRSHDAALITATRGDERTAHPFGVRVATAVTGKPAAMHYPDVLLITPQRERVAFELVLSSHGQRRLETTLGGYGRRPDHRSGAVPSREPRDPPQHQVHRRAPRNLGPHPRTRTRHGQRHADDPAIEPRRPTPVRASDVSNRRALVRRLNVVAPRPRPARAKRAPSGGPERRI